MKLQTIVTFATTTGILAAAVAATAHADGVPRRSIPSFGPPPFTWTGFYMGLNAGAAWDDSSVGLTPSGFPAAGSAQLGRGLGEDGASFTGGIQAGYNWQTGTLVLGIEADINWVDLGQGQATNAVLAAPLAGTYATALAHSIDWFGTLRARLGLTVSPQLLVYLSGGWAFGGVDSSASALFSAGGIFAGGSSDTRSGWTLGGGIEWALDRNWSFKAEYLHVDLGRQNYSFVDATAPGNGRSYSVRHDAALDVVRLGINFRF